MATNENSWQLVTSLATSAVRAQQALDAHAEIEAARRATEPSDDVAALVPQQFLSVRSLRVDAAITFRSSRRIGVEIRAGISPVLGIPLVHHYTTRSSERQSRITVHVAAVPVPLSDRPV